MPTTPNLGIIHLVPQQFQPDLVVNGALDVIDGAITGLLLVPITSADVTLSAAQAAGSFFIRVSGAFTANRNLIVPAAAHLWAVSHEGSGSHTLKVKTASGTGADIQEGTMGFVYCDGTNVIAVTTGLSSGGQPYDHAFRKVGQPGDGEILYEFVAVRDFRLPAGLSGSAGKVAGVTATSTATFPVKKNGVQVGSIIYPNTTSAPTFTMASTTDFLASVPDILSIEAPTPQDTTLSDIAVTLKGTRF
jgi:hypothetical protein